MQVVLHFLPTCVLLSLLTHLLCMLKPLCCLIRKPVFHFVPFQLSSPSLSKGLPLSTGGGTQCLHSLLSWSPSQWWFCGALRNRKKNLLLYLDLSPALLFKEGFGVRGRNQEESLSLHRCILTLAGTSKPLPHLSSISVVVQLLPQLCLGSATSTITGFLRPSAQLRALRFPFQPVCALLETEGGLWGAAKPVFRFLVSSSVHFLVLGF